MVNIKISNKSYKVEEAKFKSELRKGLKNVKSLPEDVGMLFYFNPPQKISMTMESTFIPLDQIFINEDQEVIKVVTREDINTDKLVTVDDTAYVLEVNANSGIKKGDELEFEDDEDSEPVMKVLFPDGSEQMQLWGGERIISRKETKILIKKAKKAQESQSDNDFKTLGRYIFKVFNKQDNRDAEYVSIPQ